eukprot:TRINITY_DN11503_c0_g1_i1.p1 TRINITY_DN11503_c0_g1~~TRINITY_DN11503_c0_g1_i1.p1  ORF type:complete len:250 (-),score=61.37 TRINITY_DN11503_c0_g1_i1:54-803(-)
MLEIQDSYDEQDWDQHLCQNQSPTQSDQFDSSFEIEDSLGDYDCSFDHLDFSFNEADYFADGLKELQQLSERLKRENFALKLYCFNLQEELCSKGFRPNGLSAVDHDILAEIMETGSEVQALGSAATERDQLLTTQAELKDVLAEKDASIDRMQSALREKNLAMIDKFDQISSLEDQLDESNRASIELKDRVCSMESEILELKTELAKRDSKVFVASRASLVVVDKTEECLRQAKLLREKVLYSKQLLS